MIPAHTLRNGGMSRRGFLRALGVTACAALVPGLALLDPDSRPCAANWADFYNQLHLYGNAKVMLGTPILAGGNQLGKALTIEDLRLAKSIFLRNANAHRRECVSFHGP